jgi:hypothetical protein
MVTFDSFLNSIAPIVIIGFFVGLIYVKLREPINEFFAWFKGLFTSASENVQSINLPTEIVYR